MKLRPRRILLVLLLLLLIAQVIPAERTNPPVTGDVGAPEDVAAILRRSCYDCHSNETEWPWYASVAPAKFLLATHVADGREHVNFSEWDRYDADERRHKLEECREEIETDHMPEATYLWLHPDARLSAEEKSKLDRWLASRLNR